VSLEFSCDWGLAPDARVVVSPKVKDSVDVDGDMEMGEEHVVVDR
jgi:hypothetical protein